MDRRIVAVVTGLPRSGTSLLMQMLEAGGLPPLTDGVRKPDSDNPKGYYEFERVKDLPFDVEWLEKARGRVVKINGPTVTFLPPDYTYKIVYIERNIEEVIESQEKMLFNRTRKRDASPTATKDMLSVASEMMNWLRNQRNVDLLVVSYNRLLSDPKTVVPIISNFFGGLDERKMLESIDDKLYRNRSATV